MMGMWLFMTICNLILPVLMIILGRVFVKNPPKKINNVYGYRTSRSKKNQDTWDFAHLYCGKLWWKIGWSMLPLSMISMLPAMGKNDDFIGTLGAVIITVECIINANGAIAEKLLTEALISASIFYRKKGVTVKQRFASVKCKLKKQPNFGQGGCFFDVFYFFRSAGY